VLEAQRSAALVDRKIVKQTVMTSVYGVTPVGARAQIENRLKERRTDMKQKAALVAEAGSSSSSSSSDNSWLLAASGMAAAAAAAGGVSSSAAAGGGADGVGVVARGMRDEYSWMDDKDVVWQVRALGCCVDLNTLAQSFRSRSDCVFMSGDCCMATYTSKCREPQHMAAAALCLPGVFVAWWQRLV
jgi:hypothetical protein